MILIDEVGLIRCSLPSKSHGSNKQPAQNPIRAGSNRRAVAGALTAPRSWDSGFGKFCPWRKSYYDSCQACKFADPFLDPDTLPPMRHVKCKRRGVTNQRFSVIRPDTTQPKAERLALMKGLVLRRLQELKGMEVGLNRQLAGLRCASSAGVVPSKARASFRRRLRDLEQRAIWLERLIDGLDSAAESSRLQLELV